MASPDKVERNGAAPRSNPASLDGAERGFSWPLQKSGFVASRAVMGFGVARSRSSWRLTDARSQPRSGFPASASARSERTEPP